MTDYEKAMRAMMRLNDLMGENVPEDKRTDHASKDIWTMFSVIEDYKRQSDEITTLRQQLTESQARVAKYDAMVDEMDKAIRFAYLSGPTVVGQFKSLRQQADELEQPQ